MHWLVLSWLLLFVGCFGRRRADWSLGKIADKDGRGQTINNNAVLSSRRESKYENKPNSTDVSDGVTSVKMVGEIEGRHLVMVLVVAMMASTNAAFIDKRPKMPRYTVSLLFFILINSSDRSSLSTIQHQRSLLAAFDFSPKPLMQCTLNHCSAAVSISSLLTLLLFHALFHMLGLYPHIPPDVLVSHISHFTTRKWKSSSSS